MSRGTNTPTIVFVALISTFMFSNTYAGPRYILTEIGSGDVWAYGINQKNQVVGMVGQQWYDVRAFIWTKDSGVKLLDEGNSYALAINDLGQIAGEKNSPWGRAQAAVWDNGHWVILAGRQGAIAINNKGQVAGLISAQPYIPGDYAPYRADDIYSNNFIELYSNRDWACDAFDINNKGQVVGEIGTPTHYEPIFYNSDTTYKILDNPGGDYEVEARCLNDSAQIAGSIFNEGWRAVLWDSPDSHLQYIGTLGNGWTVSRAINNSCQIVGLSDNRAFLWSKETGMLDLNTLTDPPPPFSLIDAIDISDNGSIIAWAVDSDGKNHSYLLTIPVARTVVSFEIKGPEKIKQNCPVSYSAFARYDNNSIEDVTHSTLWQVDPCAATIDAGQLRAKEVKNPRDIMLQAEYSEGGRKVNANISLTVLPQYELRVPDQYPTIQSAVDAAGYHDTVIVADGVYKGLNNRDIDFKGKAITVKSKNGPANCIIDCEGTQEDPHIGFWFHCTEEADSIIEGFTVKNGFAPYEGGAVYCHYSSPTIRNCVFTGNSAKMDGGAINNNVSSPTIKNCLFSGNTAVGNDGGAINNDDNSCPKIISSIFIKNQSFDWGGAIRNICFSKPIVSSCVLADNKAGGSGGAMYYYRGCEPVILGCTFVGNSAPKGNVLACDAYDDSDVQNYIKISNCILWNGSNPINIGQASHVTVSYSDVQNGWAGPENINADPYFIDPIGGNYRLWEKSTCINTGDPDYVPKPNETDLAGSPRILGGRIDMGAYEYNHVPLACITPIDEVFEAQSPLGAKATLNGSCSSDVDSTPGTSDNISDFNWYRFDPYNNPDNKTFIGSGQTLDCNLPLGKYLVALEVIDKAGDSASAEMTVMVRDTVPPILNCPADITLEATSPEGAIVNFEVTATDIADPSPEIICVPPSGSIFPKGTTKVSCSARDSSGNWAKPSVFYVTVQNTTPPDFKLSVSPTILWPANHKMVKIAPSWTVKDDGDLSPKVSLVGITSNDKKAAKDDIQITKDGSIYLRAEKGRFYTITYKACDRSGNCATRSATVTVPHDNGREK